MKSKRILLSDKVSHSITISEQQMGVICHALDTLAAAFSLEPEYEQIITNARTTVSNAFETDVTAKGNDINARKTRSRSKVTALVFDEKTAAEKLGVTTRTLRRWRNAGALPFIRTGILVRYNDECLETFLKQNGRNLAA